MKKYNLSKIMKRAWELVKKAGLCISEGLKLAWKEAKEKKVLWDYRGLQERLNQLAGAKPISAYRGLKALDETITSLWRVFLPSRRQMSFLLFGERQGCSFENF